MSIDCCIGAKAKKIWKAKPKKRAGSRCPTRAPGQTSGTRDMAPKVKQAKPAESSKKGGRAA